MKRMISYSLVIIPKKERSYALERLHAGYQGIEKTKALARDIVYWPGINQDIQSIIKTCVPKIPTAEH